MSDEVDKEESVEKREREREIRFVEREKNIQMNSKLVYLHGYYKVATIL